VFGVVTLPATIVAARVESQTLLTGLLQLQAGETKAGQRQRVPLQIHAGLPEGSYKRPHCNARNPRGQALACLHRNDACRVACPSR